MWEKIQRRIEQALVVCLLLEALWVNATNQLYDVEHAVVTSAYCDTEQQKLRALSDMPIAGISAELYETFLLMPLPTARQFQLIKEMEERHALAEEYAGFVGDFSTWWKSAQQLDIKASNNICADNEVYCVQERIYNIRQDEGNSHVSIRRGNFHVEEYFNTSEQTCYMDFDGYRWGHLTPATTTDALWVFCTNNADASSTVQRIQQILDLTTGSCLYGLTKTETGYEVYYVEDSTRIAEVADLFATRTNVKTCVVKVSIDADSINIEMKFNIFDDTVETDSYVYSIVRNQISDVTAPETCYWSMCDLPTLERKFTTQYNN